MSAVRARNRAHGATGRGPSSGSNRVKRGGSWNNNANNCRVANRNNNTPDNSNNNLGFRPVSTTQGKGTRCPGHAARVPPRCAAGTNMARPAGTGSPPRERQGQSPGGALAIPVGIGGGS
jgi:hypothetical protein